MNEKKLFEMITALFISKGKVMQPGTLEVWSDLLIEYPFEDLCEAFRVEMKSGNEWPVVGHVVSAVRTIMNRIPEVDENFKQIITPRVQARRDYFARARGMASIPKKIDMVGNSERNLY